jgi:hypothetical protein
MSSGVVKVGRRTYAVGLFWQPSPSGRVAQAAREAALQPGQQAEFYCVRAASKSVLVPQYGLGQANQGHKVGMPTLAASLANVQPGSWAGAFRLREGTWVIVVRDDLVAPDGDMLFHSDEQARERLLQEVSLGGVQRTYCPDGWAIPGSDPTPLPLLLQDRTDCRLQPVNLPMKLIIYVGAGVAALLVLVFVALQYQAQVQREEEERIAAIAKAKAGAISKSLEEWKWPPADQVYEHVWEKKPLVPPVLDACRQAFTQFKASQLGWKRGASTCVWDGSLSVVWNREPGKIAQVPDRSTMNDAGMIATQSLRNQGLTPRGIETLATQKEITTHVITQGLPFVLGRMGDDPPIVHPPSNVKNPPPPPKSPWVKRSVRYSGKTPLWDFRKQFENVPGFILEKVLWDGNNWIIEATIYEKREGG